MSKKDKSIIAYKGFNKDMTCRGFQFQEGQTYEESNPSICKRGFHACERPLDVFSYYAPGESVYHEVVLDGVTDERDGDSKRCASKIRIGAELSNPQLCKLTFDYVKSHCTNEYNAAPGQPATAGERGAATAGYRGAATAGERGAATAGDLGAATAGERGAATAGYRGAATSRGSSASGKNGLSVARGNGVRVKGGLGALLVIAEEHTDDFDIAVWKAAVVDGEKIKADTWYKLDENGEFAEAEE